jgi:hypothetical protein
MNNEHFNEIKDNANADFSFNNNHDSAIADLGSENNNGSNNDITMSDVETEPR